MWPDAEHLRSFSGSADVREFDKTAHVRHRANGSRHEPRQPEQRAYDDEQRQDEQVQVVPETFLRVHITQYSQRTEHNTASVSHVLNNITR